MIIIILMIIKLKNNNNNIYKIIMIIIIITPIISIKIIIKIKRITNYTVTWPAQVTFLSELRVVVRIPDDRLSEVEVTGYLLQIYGLM